VTSTEFRLRLADLLVDPRWRASILDAADPSTCFDRTRLSGREIRILIAVAHHPSVAARYDADHLLRFTPLADNLPTTCAALGDQLEAVLDGYWRAHPVASAHFLDESERFARHVATLDGVGVTDAVHAAAAVEGDLIRRQLSRRVEPPGPLGDPDVDPSSLPRQ